MALSQASESRDHAMVKSSMKFLCSRALSCRGPDNDGRVDYDTHLHKHSLFSSFSVYWDACLELGIPSVRTSVTTPTIYIIGAVFKYSLSQKKKGKESHERVDTVLLLSFLYCIQHNITFININFVG